MYIYGIIFNFLVYLIKYTFFVGMIKLIHMTKLACNKLQGSKSHIVNMFFVTVFI
jgi:hypothetical protein